MYTLYWSRRTAAFAPDAMFAEAGVDVRRLEVKRTGGRVDDPEFEKISPMKQIPALILPSGAVITESAAMVLHLGDTFADANLLPPPGSDARAQVYRWLFHMVVNIYESDLRYSYPDRYTTDPAGIPAVKAAAAQRSDRAFGVIEEALGKDGWFLGDTYSVLDPYLAMIVCWYYDTPALLEDSPSIKGLCGRIRARPAMDAIFKRYEMPELDGLI